MFEHIKTILRLVEEIFRIIDMTGCTGGGIDRTDVIKELLIRIQFAVLEVKDQHANIESEIDNLKHEIHMLKYILYQIPNGKEIVAKLLEDLKNVPKTKEE